MTPLQAGGIVWLASFPKSGNTWLRLLLANLLSPSDQPADINRIPLHSPSPVRRSNVEEMTFIDTSLLTRDELDLLRPRVIEALTAEAAGRLYIKVHDAYRLNAAGEPVLGHAAARGALYIIRDPRDVVVSLSFHNGDTTEQAIARLNSDTHTLADAGDRSTSQLPQLLMDWSGHVESWTRQRDLPLHVVRYEDLQRDPVRTFGAAVTFLGLDPLLPALEHAVQRSAFAELQSQEHRAGFIERRPQSTASFFRAGRVGAWREMLTPDQQEAILSKHRSVMARFGYT